MKQRKTADDMKQPRTCSPLLRFLRAFAVIIVATGAVAGCAPEPVSGAGGKNATAHPSESSWGQPTDDLDPEARETELPESFPIEAFEIPDDATVWSAGERAGAEQVWFLVLIAADRDEAERLWQQLIDTNAFAVSDMQETSEGGQSAQLTRESLSVTALTVPQTDGSVLLNYDIRGTVL